MISTEYIYIYYYYTDAGMKKADGLRVSDRAWQVARGFLSYPDSELSQQNNRINFLILPQSWFSK